MTSPAATSPAPLVTREALAAFTQRLVDHFAPEQVILFGTQARGEAGSTQDTLWALAEAAPLRDCLRRWFDSLGVVEPQEVYG
jgi:hypothetical protein